MNVAVAADVGAVVAVGALERLDVTMRVHDSATDRIVSVDTSFTHLLSQSLCDPCCIWRIAICLYMYTNLLVCVVQNCGLRKLRRATVASDSPQVFFQPSYRLRGKRAVLAAVTPFTVVPLDV